MTAAPTNRALLRAGWELHRFVRRVSGGRLGGRLSGRPVLELTTTGHRSGEPRIVLLTYQPHPDGFVVIASNAGADRDPAWWRNLAARPDATVSAGNETVPVRARRLDGSERETAWREIVEIDDSYETYATRTSRPIPVILLERS